VKYAILLVGNKVLNGWVITLSERCFWLTSHYEDRCALDEKEAEGVIAYAIAHKLQYTIESAT